MANSKKLLPGDLPEYVAHRLKSGQVSGRHLVLGLSGGIDSVVLLDILAQLHSSLHFSLSALHVNHRISPNASRWAAFCADQCARREIPFACNEIDVKREPGKSLEALAREARYRAFDGQQSDFAVLAQHLDDQAETLMLQLLRGAGAKGLSAMGARQERNGGTCILRPLLDVPRRLLLEYAAVRGLEWIDDESNDDVAYDRNYLRHRVMPLLGDRFPGYRVTLARAARNLAESTQLMDDLARMDAMPALEGDRLKLDALRSLSDARARNLLRYWLAGQGVSMPSSGRLENILQQLRSVRDDAQVAIQQGDRIIRRYRGAACLERLAAGRQAEALVPWSLHERLILPGLGVSLVCEQAMGQGLSLEKLASGAVTVQVRRGGERLQPDCRRPRRSLKNLLREADIPPWQRQRLPLVFCGEELVCVPGVGVACSYQADESEKGVVVKMDPV